MFACDKLLGPSGTETLFLFRNVHVRYIRHVVYCNNLEPQKTRR
jgi:hypothetical protein